MRLQMTINAFPVEAVEMYLISFRYIFGYSGLPDLFQAERVRKREPCGDGNQKAVIKFSSNGFFLQRMYAQENALVCQFYITQRIRLFPEDGMRGNSAHIKGGARGVLALVGRRSRLRSQCRRTVVIPYQPQAVDVYLVVSRLGIIQPDVAVDTFRPPGRQRSQDDFLRPVV